MTMKLTTKQIIDFIEKDIVPPWWEWESAIESAMSSDEAEAADGARFLEKLEPGHTWSAAEYHGLMHHHLTGRWESAAIIGHMRAGEEQEDALEKYEGNESETSRVKAVYAQRTASDEAAEQWIRGRVGTMVFDCADGTVLTFDGILNGQITEEDPS